MRCLNPSLAVGRIKFLTQRAITLKIQFGAHVEVPILENLATNFANSVLVIVITISSATYFRISLLPNYEMVP